MKLNTVLCYYRKITMESLKHTEKMVSMKAPWGKLTAYTWGDPAGPPVLLCPGRMEPSTTFRPLVHTLPDNFFYVSMGLPGNGLSDPLPLGIRFTVMDLVPTVLTFAEHYKWKEFIFIGHSIGSAIGRYFDIAYPGMISRLVEIDPFPAYHTEGRMNMRDWYHHFYSSYYNEDRYWKYNAGPDTAPKYTYDKIRELVKTNQGLTDEAVKHQLEGIHEPVGDGLYRFTFDQRMKDIVLMPFPSEFLQKIYTASKTPILCILAKDVIDTGVYEDVPFIMDEAVWPNRNYKYKIVKGNHDVNLNDPESIAEVISNFMVEGTKAKL